jgi:mono/diheme cytochrome c family protein
MSGLPKRIAITMGLLSLPFILGLLITYEFIKIDWVSFMEIQPSYRAYEDPLPPPAGSVPIQGAAYLPGMGAPNNPVAPDAASINRGAALYGINCAMCHGQDGKGDGAITKELARRPADLTSTHAAGLSDGDLFIIITNGLKPIAGFKGGMPGLKENLTAGDRWDVVNYVRSLQGLVTASK